MARSGTLTGTLLRSAALQGADGGPLRLRDDVGVDARREGRVAVAELLRDDAHLYPVREHERRCSVSEEVRREVSEAGAFEDAGQRMGEAVAAHPLAGLRC